jgi:PPOX class probable F420-dependent enzyme
LVAAAVGYSRLVSTDALFGLLTSHHLGALATIQADGRPHLSNVSYTFDPNTRLIRISVTDSRVKVRNLRRDPRASFHVSSNNGWSYVVAEGVGELSPVAADPNDATVEELIEVFRAIQGEHPDWQEYREAMVADKRLVLRIPVERVYGAAGSG